MNFESLLDSYGESLLKFVRNSPTGNGIVCDWISEFNFPPSMWGRRAELIKKLCCETAPYNTNWVEAYQPFKCEKRRITTFLAILEDVAPDVVAELIILPEAQKKLQELDLDEPLPTEQEPSTMNTNSNIKLRHAAILTNENIHTVNVQYDDFGHTYAYLALKEWDIQEGDLVAVPFQDLEDTRLRTCTVVSVDDEADIDVDSNIEYKFCHGKVELRANVCEYKLQETIDVIKTQRNKAARAQIRKTFMDDLMLENQSKVSVGITDI